MQSALMLFPRIAGKLLRGKVLPVTQESRKPTALAIFLLAPSLLLAQAANTQTDSSPQSQALLRLAKEVHKQLVTLPQYGVFDYLHYGIQNGDTVILRGEASRPTLKSSAENVVKKIEGVKNVQNEIELLPLSPNDDKIRAQTYAQIYSTPSLSRYTNNRGGGRFISPMRRTMGITNDPPIGWHAIHILVKNGNIRLVGVVDNDADLAMAEMRARMVPLAFGVDNDLQLSTPEPK